MADSITCPICGMTSYHPEDVKQRYCGNCHQFHDLMLAERILELGEAEKREQQLKKEIVRLRAVL